LSGNGTSEKTGGKIVNTAKVGKKREGGKCKFKRRPNLKTQRKKGDTKRGAWGEMKTASTESIMLWGAERTTNGKPNTTGFQGIRKRTKKQLGATANQQGVRVTPTKESILKK